MGRGQTRQGTDGQGQPPAADRERASKVANLAAMSVAELTDLIQDAEAALARKEGSSKRGWWKRQGQQPPKESKSRP